MTYDEKAQAKAYREAGRIARAYDEDINAAIRNNLQTIAGRRFIAWLMEITRMGQQPFVPGAADATAFNCGELNVGQQILSRLLLVSPEGYVNLLKEPIDGREQSEPDAEPEPGADAEPEPYTKLAYPADSGTT